MALHHPRRIKGQNLERNIDHEQKHDQMETFCGIIVFRNEIINEYKHVFLITISPQLCKIIHRIIDYEDSWCSYDSSRNFLTIMVVLKITCICEMKLLLLFNRSFLAFSSKCRFTWPLIGIFNKSTLIAINFL